MALATTRSVSSAMGSHEVMGKDGICAANCVDNFQAHFSAAVATFKCVIRQAIVEAFTAGCFGTAHLVMQAGQLDIEAFAAGWEEHAASGSANGTCKHMMSFIELASFVVEFEAAIKVGDAPYLLLPPTMA